MAGGCRSRTPPPSLTWRLGPPLASATACDLGSAGGYPSRPRGRRPDRWPASRRRPAVRRSHSPRCDAQAAPATSPTASARRRWQTTRRNQRVSSVQQSAAKVLLSVVHSAGDRRRGGETVSPAALRPPIATSDARGTRRRRAADRGAAAASSLSGTRPRLPRSGAVHRTRSTHAHRARAQPRTGDGRHPGRTVGGMPLASTARASPAGDRLAPSIVGGPRAMAAKAVVGRRWRPRCPRHRLEAQPGAAIHPRLVSRRCVAKRRSTLSVSLRGCRNGQGERGEARRVAPRTARATVDLQPLRLEIRPVSGQSAADPADHRRSRPAAAHERCSGRGSRPMPLAARIPLAVATSVAASGRSSAGPAADRSLQQAGSGEHGRPTTKSVSISTITRRSQRPVAGSWRNRGPRSFTGVTGGRPTGAPAAARWR